MAPPLALWMIFAAAATQALRRTSCLQGFSGEKAMRIASIGHVVFAATLIAIGVMGLVRSDFAPIWQPVPKDIFARGALAYLCAIVALAVGFGIVWRSTAPLAARLLLAWLLLCMALFKIPALVRAPASQDSWSNAGESAVYLAAAGIFCTWFGMQLRSRLNFRPARFGGA